MVEGARIYNLFPLLAGPMVAWEPHLDRIQGMGFDWVFVNPIHYPGFSGSLYAVKDYYRLNPLVENGDGASVDDHVRGLVAAAEKRGLKIMMDLVVNHTGKDSVLAAEHPNWFQHNPDGSLSAPFAMDSSAPGGKVVWDDLASIDFRDRPERREVIAYFSEVIRHYTALGVGGFRCDAAYKVPKDVWRELIRAGQSANPDSLFIAENLGASPDEVDSMRGGGFDFLFNSSKWWDFRQSWLLDQYERFRSIAPSVSFPETHDTDRLIADLDREGVREPAEIERRYKQAYLFAATFSSGVMIPMGYEYGFRKRLHVVKTRTSDWEKPLFDLTGFIGAVNRMRAGVPVLNEEGPQRAAFLGDGRAVALIRRGMRGGDWAVTLINIDRWNDVWVRMDGLDGDVDKGREVTPARDPETLNRGQELRLGPGEVRVFVKQ